MANLITVGKVGFFLSLLLTHFVFFGLPALRSFLASEVSVLESTVKSGNISSPAVTLCPYKTGFSGWRNSTLPPALLTTYDIQCKEAAGAEEFVACVGEKTFNFAETMSNGSTHGTGRYFFGVNLTSNFWFEDTSVAMAGRCFTLNYSQPLGPNLEKSTLGFNLNRDLLYKATIHSPTFYLYSWNPVTIPNIDIELDFKELGDSWYYIYLKAGF